MWSCSYRFCGCSVRECMYSIHCPVTCGLYLICVSWRTNLTLGKLWHWCPSVWGVLLLFLATALYIERCFENHCCRFEFIWLQLLICLCFNESDCVFVFLSCLLCLWVDRLLYQLGCYFRLFFPPVSGCLYVWSTCRYSLRYLIALPIVAFQFLSISSLYLCTWL